MAGELKYGNTLVSSRKDETLTYSKYVKGLESGKSVEEELKELAARIDQIPQDNHDSAYHCSYLAVPDFALDDSVSQLTGQARYEAVKNLGNAWFDEITFNVETDPKYIGRCKLFWDGVNIECYNYVCSWAEQTGVQQLTGSVKIGDDGRVDMSNTHSILYRTYENGEWSEWHSYSIKTIVKLAQQADQYASTPIDNEEIDRLFE